MKIQTHKRKRLKEIFQSFKLEEVQRNVKLIDNIVKNSNISFVEVPNALMGAARVIGKTKANNFKGNISFN